MRKTSRPTADDAGRSHKMEVSDLTLLAILIDDDSLFEDLPTEPKRKHSCWERPWISRREECDTVYTLLRELQAADDTLEFRRMVRMDQATYTDLLDMVRPFIQKQHTRLRAPISPEVRLAVTMRFLAFGPNYPALAHDFRLGVTSVMNIIRETCVAIHTVMKGTYLKTPRTSAEWRIIARNYQCRWNFPHCIGALDGKHIRIKKPKNSGSAYHNYKSYFSLVLLALVDANYCFIHVDVGAEGRNSDGGVWENSKFRKAMEDKRLNIPPADRLPESDRASPYVIVGDDAFPLGENLLKPYSRRDLAYDERVFNYRLSRARRCSENAFGILASRFRLFLHEIEAEPENAEKFLMAAICLHNFLRQKCGKSYITPGAVDREGPDNQILPGDWRELVHSTDRLQPTRSRNSSDWAKAARCTFKDYFVSEVGSVPWQDRAIDFNE